MTFVRLRAKEPVAIFDHRPPGATHIFLLVSAADEVLDSFMLSIEGVFNPVADIERGAFDRGILQDGVGLGRTRRLGAFGGSLGSLSSPSCSYFRHFQVFVVEIVCKKRGSWP